MSDNPEERNRESRKAGENNLDQPAPPVDKQDPTNPVKVGGSKEGKAAASADVGDAGAAKA